MELVKSVISQKLCLLLMRLATLKIYSSLHILFDVFQQRSLKW